MLDRALEVFWDKGYEGTSIADLTEATGLGRASLYGAFGDKEKLYGRVVEHYLARSEACAPPSRRDDASTRDLLLATFTAWFGARCAELTSRGCFLSLAGTQGGEPAFARELFLASLKRREKTLTKILRDGQERGDVDPEADPAALARLLVVVTQGVAATARAGWSAERLDEAVRDAVDLVAPRSRPPRVRR